MVEAPRTGVNASHFGIQVGDQAAAAKSGCTFADASQGGLPWREVPVYVAAQAVGAFAGVA